MRGEGRDDRHDQAMPSSSSSVKLLLFMVPLIVVSGFVAFLQGQKGPISNNWTSSISTTAITSSSDEIIDQTGENDEALAFYEDSASLDLEAIRQLPTENYTLELLNETQTTTVVAASATTNGRDVSPTKAKLQKLGSNLRRLEDGLRKARAAIREAKYRNQTQDPDYVPLGPMYHNANAFHRSYLEMEKQFKVFIYEEGDPPVFHNGPCKSIYSTEGNFIHGLEVDGRFRTRDPGRAHVFFLPFSVAMMVQFVYVRDSRDFTPIRQTIADYVRVIASKHPFWNQSLAADHFMLSCHDWGPEASKSLPYLYKNSIRVLCNANTSEGFNPAKDVSFPEINLRTGDIRGFLGGPSPSKRPILAFFAGGLHGPIRPLLLKYWENKDAELQIRRYLPKGVSYYDMMKKSRYCICPSGYEVASPRVVEALYTGCVPVLVSDHYVPPFSDVLNWKAFAIDVRTEDIPNLKNILTSISTRQYIRMQRRGVQVRRHFEVNSPPKRFDVYHMILHSVWLRRLNIRVREIDVS